MPKKLTAKIWNDRGNVYSALADFLHAGEWTGSQSEVVEGISIAAGLDKEAYRCWEKAKRIKGNADAE
ncbi:hypothetical protein ACIOG3_03765 [Yersinia rochesterensis]|uniref:hypothetical protein n=1 Tax=Yersinia rochesterensis TaxID=1604335 RepID=UPI0004F5AB72|nr:hypothetical protein [Yersinia rochesterensis]AIN20349.1 hypothetical protein DJ57_2598 [Yersinia rochesterensis]CRY63161.1 Uncharacterised protein [Yersinia kristensenii]